MSTNATDATISSNGLSVDQQIEDAVQHLTDEQRETFNAVFPEYATLTWDGGWVNTEVSGVEVDYMSWAADWIEANTGIYWEDGEPWMGEGHFPEDNAEPSPTLADERTNCAGGFLGAACPWTPANTCPIHSTADIEGN